MFKTPKTIVKLQQQNEIAPVNVFWKQCSSYECGALKHHHPQMKHLMVAQFYC